MPRNVPHLALPLLLGLAALLSSCDGSSSGTADSVVPPGPGGPPPVGPPSGNSPDLIGITLNNVTPEFNGEGFRGGTMQVRQNGWVINATFFENGGSIDPEDALITANVAVQASGVTIPAGEDLAGVLTVEPQTDGADYSVPPEVIFPIGETEITVVIRDIAGTPSAPARFNFLVGAGSDEVRPFETQQVWFIDLTRDIESYTVTIDPVTGTFICDITVNPEPNGIPDLDELFLIVGLFSAAPLASVDGILDSNQVVMARYKTEIQNILGQMFAGVNIGFTYSQPTLDPFPEDSASVPYASFPYSQICIAGATDPDTPGVAGRALLDINNRFQNNNCLVELGSNPSRRLGVFLHTGIRSGYFGAPTSLFRTTYDPFTVDIAGLAIGDDTIDRLRLIGGLSDTRRAQIDAAITRMAQYTAFLIAHECGHSLGLVATGPMPGGLFGQPAQPGIPADPHITVPFPPGSQNIMAASGNFATAQGAFTGFNSLILAYLREQVIHNRQF